MDMLQPLQLGAAALPRVRPSLPATANIETHRLTFAAFPIIGYSLTSDTVPPERLWEAATYDINPRIHRLDGVATVGVQGGRVAALQTTPRPATLATAAVTGTGI